MYASIDSNNKFTGMGVSTPGSGAVSIIYMTTWAQGLTPDPRTGRIDLDGTLNINIVSAQKITLSGAGYGSDGIQVGYPESYTVVGAGSFGVATGATGINSILMGPVQVGTQGTPSKGTAPGTVGEPYWPPIPPYLPKTSINGMVNFGALVSTDNGQPLVAPNSFIAMNPVVTNYGYYCGANRESTRWTGLTGTPTVPVDPVQFSMTFVETGTPANTIAITGPQDVSTPYINGNGIRFIATPATDIVGSASPGTQMTLTIKIYNTFNGSNYIPTYDGTTFFDNSNVMPYLVCLQNNMTLAAAGNQSAPEPMITGIVTTLITAAAPVPAGIQFVVSLWVPLNNTWSAGVPFLYQFNFGWIHN